MTQSTAITIPHSLPKDVAMRRVLSWLQSQQGTDQHVTPVSTVIDNQAHSITLKLLAYGYPITATISVSSSQVDLKTSETTTLIEGAAMWWEQMQLQKQLAEVLK